MRFGIAVFPGTWSDRDCAHAVELSGNEAVMLWHKDRDLRGADCVMLPGGFSYGDYLRAGAVARFAPLMEAVVEFTEGGGLAWGICNGFQVLCEAHLLPGALTRNASLQFRCEPSWLRVETDSCAFTASCRVGDVLQIPVSHGEGRYVADEATLDELERDERVVFRYVTPAGLAVGAATPNGSMRDIAGIVNPAHNVLGMMPHPERACEPLLGSADGMRLITSVARSLRRDGALAASTR
ncbi:MAG: phosphoribosylformylglycinamidine synthase subunit PurQ [Candidatus Dormibacteraeota bacterium]|nr:phosphoribosylformylglycinamidine synthase subunit PurQ [Candidatus Dormibacteraeota bacterium]MBV9525106.1 phosphoribosylformylglycinamidine synthase subunit PurQ [Candidatus Dormibacteraeota bacterium]